MKMSFASIITPYGIIRIPGHFEAETSMVHLAVVKCLRLARTCLLQPRTLRASHQHQVPGQVQQNRDRG
jgi:hypothetical protein